MTYLSSQDEFVHVLLFNEDVLIPIEKYQIIYFTEAVEPKAKKKKENRKHKRRRLSGETTGELRTVLT